MSHPADNDTRCDGCGKRPCVCETVVLPSADYDALAADDEFRRLMRQACNDPGSFVQRERAMPGGPLTAESMTSWQDRAIRAALTRPIPPAESGGRP